MKYKDQLRGFAVGVVVTAVLMSVIFRLSETPEKSVEVAKGQETVDDLQESTVVEPLEEKEESKYPTIEEVAEDIVEEPEVDETNPIDTTESETAKAEEDEPEVEVLTEDTGSEQLFYLQVVSGDSSVSVSNKLAELGLVPDAREYDLYLCANGYDKKIRTGNHEIKEGATFEEIAEEISSR